MATGLFPARGASPCCLIMKNMASTSPCAARVYYRTEFVKPQAIQGWIQSLAGTNDWATFWNRAATTRHLQHPLLANISEPVLQPYPLWTLSQLQHSQPCSSWTFVLGFLASILSWAASYIWLLLHCSFRKSSSYPLYQSLGVPHGSIFGFLPSLQVIFE